MTLEAPGEGSLDYMPCRYGRSRLLFRGPRRDLSGRFVAVLGGIETYGRYVPQPYPHLAEQATGTRVVNLGCPSAGPDAWLSDPGLMEVLQKAALTVIQVPPASDLTNRLYSVHPRRNDRFVKASPILRSVYRGVDFTDFAFTRHMLRTLFEAGPERFAVVVDELRAAWLSRMDRLLSALPGRKALLWTGHRPPAARSDAPLHEPLLVDADLLRSLAPATDGLALAVPTPAALSRGTKGMVFPALSEPAARGLPNAAVHRETATVLAGLIRSLA